MKKYRFNTWEVYPVVDHFQRHFKSIWARFSNVMGPVPDFMQDQKVMKDLKNLRDDLDKDFVINVFGRTDIERKDIVMDKQLVETKSASERRRTDIERKDIVMDKQLGETKSASERRRTYIERKDIVMDKQLGETKSASERKVGITVDLIVVRCEGTDQTDIMKELHKHLKEVSSNRQTEIVVCYGNETDLSESAEEDIKLQIKDTLQKAYLDCHFFIVKGSVKDELGKKLSDVFERRVAGGFLAIWSDLRRFVQEHAPKSATVDETNLLIETESCVRAIKNFLYSSSLVMDFGEVEKVSFSEGSEQVQKGSMSVGVQEQTVTLEHSKREKSNLVEEDSGKTSVSGSAKDGGGSNIVVRALSKMIRCAAVEPLAVRFQLPQWVCNGVLIRMNFEEKLVCCLSKNTKYHLGKLVGNESPKQKFGFILYEIQRDYTDSKVENDVKTVLSAMKRLTDVMKKMAFEANGHLQQTILKEESPIRDNKETRKRYRDMRREILELDGIFGLGTVFDQLEIHFEESDKINVDTLKTEVDNIMKKHHYFNNYCIKKVISPSTAYARHYFEQGDIVSCPYPDTMREFRKGTLGGFASDKDGKVVYGLTCAHVVNPFDSDRLVVCIQKTEHQPRKPFARSTPQAVVLNMSDLPFVDIAAVELRNSFDDNYDFDFKNEKKQSKPALLADEIPQPGTHVYKFGAITGLTEGIISSPYYQLKASLQTELDQFEDNYIILIEHSPGIPADIPSAIGNVEETEEISLKKRKSETTVYTENKDSGVELSEHQSYVANNDLSVQTKVSTGLDLNTHKNSVEHGDLPQTVLVGCIKDQPDKPREDADRRSEIDAEKVPDDSGVVLYDRAEANNSESVGESKGRQTDSNGLTRDEKNERSGRSPNPEIADEECERNAEFGNQIDPQQSSVKITKFAEPGDSGAIVCSFDPKSDTVAAIAMFRGGDMVLRRVGEASLESVCCSFLLKKGLQELGKRFKNDPYYFKLDVAKRRQKFINEQ